MTLHEAIKTILTQSDRPLSAKEIAAEINAHQLYKRSDGNQVMASQIHSRVNKYPLLFFYNDNKEILRRRNELEDLINTSKDFQDQLNKSITRYKIIVQRVDLLIPAFFFFKRMFDNPQLMQKHLNLTDDYQAGDFTGMLKFYDILNKNAGKFNGKLTELISDIELLNKFSFYPFLARDFNLSQSQYSILEFGRFFNLLLYQNGKQDIKGGQFITNEIIGNLFFKICEKGISKGIKIYNPGAGFSTIPAIFAQKSGIHFEFTGEEIVGDVYLLSLMNLIANDIEVNSFFNDDSFNNPLNPTKHNVVICVPPFGAVTQIIPHGKNFPIESRDITHLFIQLCVNKLAEGGKAVLLVPERVLFDSSKSYLQLRKFLITNQFLESIISLPTGLLQSAIGLKTSMLILSRKKNRTVAFIKIDSLASLNSYLSEENPVYGSDSQQEDRNIVKEPSISYGAPPVSIVPLEKISESGYDLVASRYQIIEDPEESKKSKLNEVLSSYSGERNSTGQNLKFVNIRDLNELYYDINLDIISLNPASSNQEGRVISSSSLLIGSIVPNIKPTWFRMENEPVIISWNIHAFKVNTGKIDIEYLIYELQTKEIKEQLVARASGGTSIQRISSKDFLELKINIPSLKDQKEKVRVLKESLYSLKIDHAKRFGEKAGLTLKKEEELLGFLKHEMGNITGGINSDIRNLKVFLLHHSIDLDNKISERTGSNSLNEVFNRMQNNINDMDELFSNIQNIIDFGNSQINKNPVYIRRFIKRELDKFEETLEGNQVDAFIGFDGKYNGESDRTITIDESQFSLVIRNFIVNSIKHGFQEKKSYHLVFNIYGDEDFDYIEMINDGLTFPEGFSLNDFLRFGGRSDNSKGSGLGGFLTGKIIENHGGEIDLLKPGRALFLNDPIIGTDAYADHTLISSTVHFLIKLPKE